MPLADEPYASEPHSALEPRIPTHEAAFEPLMLAHRDRRPVVFDYRKSNAAHPERRTVEPWILECWRGHWYLAGWDRDRAAERVFRLSRITGRVRSRAGAFTAEVPDHVTVQETVETWAGETATSTARIRLRAGHGYPLRAKAVSIRPVAEQGAADDEPAGWDELEIPYGHGLDGLAGGVRTRRRGPGTGRVAGRPGGAAARRGQRLRGADLPWLPTPSTRHGGCCRW